MATIATRFTEALMDQHGVSREDAEKVYVLYRDLKILKIDGVNGSFTLAHGAAWDRAVIVRAVKQVNSERDTL